MNSLFYLMLCATILILEQSCAITSTTHFSSRKATANIRFVTENSISETPVVTDLVVEEKKVSGSFSGKNAGEEAAKNLAVFDALKRANAEILVEPLYDIEIKDNNEITVKVEGFPARYTNFRKPTHQDSLILGLIAPRADLVLVEIEKNEKSGGGGCCCCGNNSGFITSATTTVLDNPSSPANTNNPFTLTQQPAPVDNAKPSEGTLDTQKFKTDYINEYKRLKAKGHGQLVLGGSFFYLLPISIPLFIAGGANKRKAKRMKLEAPQHGIDIALYPLINPYSELEALSAEQQAYIKNQQ